MKKFLNVLFRGVEILIAVFLALMILTLFMNVVLRQFGKGFVWSEEIARIAFIYLVYLGSIGAARENRHLLVDSILVKLPEIPQKIVYFLLQVCIIWLMWIITSGSWMMTIQTMNDKWVATGYPTFLVWGVGLVTGIAIIIISLANIFRLIVLKESVTNLVKTHDDTPNTTGVETREIG
ncbi:hypothetical protein AGMMS50212_06950 [Spirochaetia bacterium]|nr:hypothetical protein AGMMS50212_06950 [Spirochaetia bacterium]